MKKRILSLVLVLTFVLLALPMSVSAASTPSSEFADWTAKIGSISALNGGVFQINAHSGEGNASTLTDKAHGRMAMWNGSLYEGKISVTLDTASIFAKRAPYGCTNPGTGTNDTGIIFGGKGIKELTPADNWTVNSVENNSQFYFLYFGNNSLRLALADETNTVNGAQKAWVGTIKDKADDSLLEVDLNANYKTMWDAAKADGKAEVTVAWSAAGAVRVWVNGTHIKELDGEAGTAVPFGPEVGVRAGMGYHVPTKVYDFKVEGGLELKVVQGNATYDADTYTLTTQNGATLAYFSNRDIKDGSIKTTFPTVNDNSDQSGIVVGLADNGSATREGVDIAYYMLQLRIKSNTNKFRWCMSNGAVATEEMKALTGTDRQNATNTYIDSRVTGYDFNTNTGPACNWFFGGDKDITDLNNIVASFKITGTSAVIDSSAINTSVGSFTDSKPFNGGFYGIRSDKGTVVSVYAVNNVKEAIGLDIDAGNLDLSALETGKTYEVKVKTFPAGSVINSGETVKLGGTGIAQSGKAVLNSDGSYTVKFMATSANATALKASVDNHIFGTLSASVAITAAGDNVDTGDATFLIGAGVALVAILGTAVIVGKKRTVA